MLSCGKCGPLVNMAMGDATECGHQCSSRGYKWCGRCALLRGVCQLCGNALPSKDKKKKKPRKRR